MIILYLLKNFFISFKKGCSSFYRNAALKAKHPTGMFDLTSQIVDCDFEKYVVVFENTKLCNSRIDSYTYIQKNSTVFNAEIGKFCSIASGVSIAPGMHDLTKVTTHPSFYFNTDALPKIFVTEDKLELYKRVHIGHDVWIGEKVVIIDGIKIGNGAVIASGAIVVKDVEPYSVVGGVPARHLKYRFDDETIALFEKSEWWNYSDEWFEKNADMMLDVYKFKEYLKEL
jgi:acetyltransferase-like isoleucine patch superfamily enzyme